MFKERSDVMRASVCKRAGAGQSIGACLCRAAGAAALWVVMSAAGQAQDAAALAQKHLYAGTLAEGQAELTRLVARQPNDPSARFALGGIQFMRAVEGLAQSLHRHGLEAPPRPVNVPILRLPVPPNPRPEPLTYEGFRGILQRLVEDLGA